MKLLSVRVIGNDNFRSLKVNKTYSFRQDESYANLFEGPDVQSIYKTVFTGVNGSGKSNFLQLLSEIFAHLEMFHLKSSTQADKEGDFGYEIIYSIFLTADKIKNAGYSVIQDQNIVVRITKNLQEPPEFSLKLSANESWFVVDNNTELLLPDKIIAYSSGQNELISNPFFKIKYRYFLEVENHRNVTKFGDRFLFIDYNTSRLYFVANFLLLPLPKLDLLKKHLKIESLVSFRISISFLNSRSKTFVIPNEMMQHIETLKLCATAWINKKGKNQDLLILDFLLDNSGATQSAFRHFFHTAGNLFDILFQLDALNAYSVGSVMRRHIASAPKWVNFAEELGKVDPFDLQFRIERIQIKRSYSNEMLEYDFKPTYYRSLSDGEHQFSHVVGALAALYQDNTLCLFDEPETHFNPRWKYEYLSTLDKVISIKSSHLLMTTHDPVMLSGLKQNEVIIFHKNIDGTANIAEPDSDLKGMGIDAILTSNIFGLNTTLDKQTYQAMLRRRELLLEKEKHKLSDNQDSELRYLSEQLIDIDYYKPFEDPLYKDFLLSLQDLEAYKPTEINESEKRLREEVALSIGSKIKANK